MWKILTLADKLLLLLLSGATLSSFFFLDLVLEHGAAVSVEVDGTQVYRGNLSGEKTFVVQGTRGELTVEIHDGSVRVIRADCPNKICVRMGERNRAGDIIVCVPNRTIIRIEGRRRDVRAVTG